MDEELDGTAEEVDEEESVALLLLLLLDTGEDWVVDEAGVTDEVVCSVVVVLEVAVVVEDAVLVLLVEDPSNGLRAAISRGMYAGCAETRRGAIRERKEKRRKRRQERADMVVGREEESMGC